MSYRYSSIDIIVGSAITAGTIILSGSKPTNRASTKRTHPADTRTGTASRPTFISIGASVTSIAAEVATITTSTTTTTITTTTVSVTSVA